MDAAQRPSALASTWLPHATWDHVEAAMQAPGRHYHNLDHLDAMIRMAERLRFDRLPFWRDLVAAVLFHDLIYDPTRSDNEERSADAARAMLSGAGLNIDDVVGAILATRHHKPEPDDRLSTTLCDLDMAILSSDRYRDDYAVLIRKEYAHVPQQAYVAGRIAFLRSCSNEPIYFAPEPPLFSDEQAHANLRVEIAQLLGNAGDYLVESR